MRRCRSVTRPPTPVEVPEGAIAQSWLSICLIIAVVTTILHKTPMLGYTKEEEKKAYVLKTTDQPEMQTRDLPGRSKKKKIAMLAASIDNTPKEKEGKRELQAAHAVYIRPSDPAEMRGDP